MPLQVTTAVLSVSNTTLSPFIYHFSSSRILNTILHRMKPPYHSLCTLSLKDGPGSFAARCSDIPAKLPDYRKQNITFSGFGLVNNAKRHINDQFLQLFWIYITIIVSAPVFGQKSAKNNAASTTVWQRWLSVVTHVARLPYSAAYICSFRPQNCHLYQNNEFHLQLPLKLVIIGVYFQFVIIQTPENSML